MRTVAFVGFSRVSNQAVFDGLPAHVEIWTLNHAHKFDWRIDRLFEVHEFDQITDPHYYTDEIRTQHLNYLYSNQTAAVYMQTQHTEIPSSVVYPLAEALRLTVNRKRYRSTFDYMAALAIIEKVDRVEIYGFDMDPGTEYDHQRPSAVYWIGRMEGAGIDVEIDPHSSLFPEVGLYGYERTQMVPRHTLEEQKKKFAKQRKVKTDQLRRWEGILQDRTRHGGGLQEANEQVRKYERQVATVEGAVQILQQLIDVCDLKE